MTNHIRIGIDIGRVIIADDTDQGPSIFSRDFLNAPAVPMAIEVISGWAQAISPQQLFLVSKCGTDVAQRSMAWLHHNSFFEKTGIEPSQVHFCRERHEKAGIADALGLTHFVDDRYTVLKHLLHLEALYLFDPSAKEKRLFTEARAPRKQVVLVRDWETLGTRLRF